MSPASRQQAAAPRNRAWWVILPLLVALTLANLTWTFRGPLATQFPQVHLKRPGSASHPPAQPSLQARDIRLLSRDLYAHPDRVGILVLSATFVSKLPEAVPWPLLELELFDASNRPLALRRFQAAEYLGSPPGPGKLLEPGAHVPVSLEFVDPGDRATGFELHFLQAPSAAIGD